MAQSTTRGRSFTDFPRNTKERHVRTCAQEAREQARKQAEIEAAYSEWTPTQVFQQEHMEQADFVAWDVNNVVEGFYPGTGVSREWAVYVKPDPTASAELGIDLS